MQRFDKALGEDLEQAMLESEEKIEAEENQPEVQPVVGAEVSEMSAPKEPKFLPMVLLILQIIGAIPTVIAAAEKLWNWIQQIKDRKKRYEMRLKFRQMVYGQRTMLNRKKQKTMSADENSELERQIEIMSGEVAGILENQGG